MTSRNKSKMFWITIMKHFRKAISMFQEQKKNPKFQLLFNFDFWCWFENKIVSFLQNENSILWPAGLSNSISNVIWRHTMGLFTHTVMGHCSSCLLDYNFTTTSSSCRASIKKYFIGNSSELHVAHQPAIIARRGLCHFKICKTRFGQI